MAVGKIEYKKILDDKNLTPTKLKDLYVSSLKNDNTFDGYNKHFVNDSSERYTIMTPEAAAAVIASRQQANAPEQPVESDEEVVVDEEVTTIGCGDGIDTRIVLGHIFQQGHLAPRLASILAVGGGHETVAGAC